MIALLVAAIAAASLVERRAPSPTRSTLNPDPGGTAALWRVVQELAPPARRWRLPHAELATVRGVLVMISPFEEPLEESESETILAWVKRGNALLLLTSAGEALMDRAVPWDDRELLVRLGWEHADLVSPANEGTADASARMLGSEGAKDLGTAIPSPLFAGGARLASGAGIRLAAPRGAWAPLVASEVGVRGWLGSLGRGRVVVLACPSIVENRRLDQAANLPFVLALLERLRGGGDAAGEVLFDERVHGHHELIPGTELPSGARRVVAAHLLLAALVYVAGRGRRLGPPLAEPPPGSRSAVELAESMAALYRRARLHREALAALARDHRASGVRDPALEIELDRQLARRRVRARELVRLDRWMTEAQHRNQERPS